MDVIGHDTPGSEVIALAVEVEDGIADDGGDARVFHPCFALALVKGGFDMGAVKFGEPVSEVGCEGGIVVFFRGCELLLQVFFLETVGLQGGLWERVCESEGNRVGGSFAIPMREVAP